MAIIMSSCRLSFPSSYLMEVESNSIPHERQRLTSSMCATIRDAKRTTHGRNSE
jgi:hypothetical protein